MFIVSYLKVSKYLFPENPIDTNMPVEFGKIPPAAPYL